MDCVSWVSVCPPVEVHPLLGVKGDGKSKKKQAGRPKGSKGKERESPFNPKLYKGGRGSPLEGSAEGRVQAGLSQPPAGKDAREHCLPCSVALLCTAPDLLQLRRAFPPSPPSFPQHQVILGFQAAQGRLNQNWLNSLAVSLRSIDDRGSTSFRYLRSICECPSGKELLLSIRFP